MENEQKPPVRMNDLWTIPNLLSVSRVIFIIPIVYLLKENTQASNLLAFFIIGLAYLTDLFDGMIARLAKQESELGKILDPLADKLLTVTIAATLYIQNRLPLYFFGLVLTRDIILSIGAIYVINSKKIVLQAILWGKVATFGLGVVLSVYPLRNSIFWDNASMSDLISGFVRYGTWAVSALLILSLVFYIVNYYKNFFGAKEETIDK